MCTGNDDFLRLILFDELSLHLWQNSYTKWKQSLIVTEYGFLLPTYTFLFILVVTMACKLVPTPPVSCNTKTDRVSVLLLDSGFVPNSMAVRYPRRTLVLVQLRGPPAVSL
ncbi:hypothetical protein K435DRAFT_164507 [Dendrothele bispora CBS 962.96]|uniref:Uncharacterized protein n=1 Tax=Dendrothele bispora (strain CBS 962.96) TaxID=1314807 RepID=A0A4S8KLD9_DENBC|nr:hypothetical protein K435DRAFT_164507 [Dendrothele bispora CBS 962.96]